MSLKMLSIMLGPSLFFSFLEIFFLQRTSFSVFVRLLVPENLYSVTGMSVGAHGIFLLAA
jgi:hypothetical protein